MTTRRTALAALSGLGLSPSRALFAAEPDWPQWRGPNRDGISAETGLLRKWPAEGPRKLWSATGLGSGFGSLAIRGNRIFVQGAKGSQSYLHCLPREGGKILWSVDMGPRADNDRGDGPRGTPTVEGEMLYCLSEAGLLACLKTSDGSPVWRKHILKDYGGENPHWLLSESPLVEGNMLLVTPGGRGAGVVAIEKTSGKEIWRSKELSDPAHYSSLIAGTVDGVRFVTTMTARSGVGLRASDGKLMWRYDRACNGTANCTTPVIEGNRVFYTSAYGTGGGVVELSGKDGVLEAKEAWFNREMMNHHGGVVLHKGHLYGFSNAILTCQEMATGVVKWKDRSVGKGSLTFADGMLFLMGEGQTAGLAEASAEGYTELGRFRTPDSGKPSWAHPVVCGGRLYLRDQDTLTCYAVKA